MNIKPNLRIILIVLVVVIVAQLGIIISLSLGKKTTTYQNITDISMGYNKYAEIKGDAFTPSTGGCGCY